MRPIHARRRRAKGSRSALQHVAAFGLAVVAILASAVAVPAQPFDLPDSTRGEQLAAAVAGIEWGQSLADWRLKREDEGYCREYRRQTLGSVESEGGDSTTLPWAVWCREGNQHDLNESVFYTVRDDVPIAARLERIVWRLTVPPPRLEPLRRAVELSLDKTLGAAERLALPTLVNNRIVASRDEIADEPSAYQARDARRWRQRGVAEIVLYVYDSTDGALPAQLILRARSQPLIDNMAKDQRMRQVVKLTNPLELLFREQLARRLPDAIDLLPDRWPSGAAHIDAQPRLFDAIRRAVAMLDSVGTNDRAFVLLLIDRLADELWLFDNQSPDSVFATGVLNLLQLQPPANERSWSYPATLRRRVVHEYAGSPWGDYAFFQLFIKGFAAGIFDQAHVEEVMTRSGDFLRQRPESPHRPLLLFGRALAADTIWSLTQAPPYDVCVGSSPPEFDLRALAATRRDQAIAAYETTRSQLPPDDIRREFIERQLLRLRSGYDTGARFFFGCYP